MWRKTKGKMRWVDVKGETEWKKKSRRGGEEDRGPERERERHTRNG